MRSHIKIITALGLGICLEGCASQIEYSPPPPEAGQSVVEQGAQNPSQCVPYARDHSNVKIYGDAYTWWDKASSHYLRSPTPRVGAVMVLSNYSGPERAHLAVVRTLVGGREIRVDHANWLDDGAIYLNDPVLDVSPNNDWSLVRVYNIKTAAWGGKIYPVQGFIGGGAHEDLPDGTGVSDKVALAPQPDPGRSESILDLLR